LDDPAAADRLGGPGGGVVVVHGAASGIDAAGDEVLAQRVASVPTIVVASGAVVESGPPSWADVVAADEDDAAALVASAAAHPIAATSLAVLLRAQPDRSTDAALVAESAVYSALQAGPEFAAWRRGRRPSARDREPGPLVRLERTGDRLVVALHRPHLHNAFSAAMRDELLDGLAVAEADPSVAVLELRGDGPSFCSGVDLDEFGSRPDPATAHLARLTRNAGRALARVSERTTAFVHGATMGSGIELAAFAGRVVADPDTSIALPELALGLVPGAGGTVSLTRRAGRHATLHLALSGPIDAATALAWRLVDEVREVG
jgi:hypothetical protein